VAHATITVFLTYLCSMVTAIPWTQHKTNEWILAKLKVDRELLDRMDWDEDKWSGCSSRRLWSLERDTTRRQPFLWRKALNDDDDSMLSPVRNTVILQCFDAVVGRSCASSAQTMFFCHVRRCSMSDVQVPSVYCIHPLHSTLRSTVRCRTTPRTSCCNCCWLSRMMSFSVLLNTPQIQGFLLTYLQGFSALSLSLCPSRCWSTAPHAVVLTLMREHYCCLYMLCHRSCVERSHCSQASALSLLLLLLNHNAATQLCEWTSEWVNEWMLSVQDDGIGVAANRNSQFKRLLSSLSYLPQPHGLHGLGKEVSGSTDPQLFLSYHYFNVHTQSHTLSFLVYLAQLFRVTPG